VSREGYLSYRGSRYAVPPEYAGRLLLVKEGADRRLRVYAGEQPVVDYALAEQRRSVVTTPDHAAAVRALARAKARPGIAPTGSWELRSIPWPEVQLRPLAAYDEAVGLLAAGGS
jgi:hypothetical protein